jgi:ubiquitin C-terminal hydrolase
VSIADDGDVHMHDSSASAVTVENDVADAAGSTTSATATTTTTTTVPSAAEQAAIVKDFDSGARKVELKEGDTWYLIESKWVRGFVSVRVLFLSFVAHVSLCLLSPSSFFQQQRENAFFSPFSSFFGRFQFSLWTDFSGIDAADGVGNNVPPGPITNARLLTYANDHMSLMSHMMELQDYMLVPGPMWHCLHSWHGGGPAIPRVVVRKQYSRELGVDVHFHVVLLVRSSQLDAPAVELVTSKNTKLRHFREQACKLLGLVESDVQLWDYHMKSKSKLLSDLDATLSDENIINKQFVLLEERGADGRFARHAVARDFLPVSNATPGLCGLNNLGNTCFMNSALQCMSATAPLRRFFLTGRYQNDINKANPLGCGGELALVFGELLDALWAGRYNSFGPREFKHQLERFAHQFQGYQQHDSQELLAFLLDGLHEDLNRVKQKPFVEAVEGNGRPDAVVADEAWHAHKRRNDSIVVDEFMGQLKSTVECDVCDRVSVTFDPFMYLSVPLPQVTTRTIALTLVRADGSTPTKFAVTVDKEATVLELKQGLERLCGIAPSCIVIADVYMSRVSSDLHDRKSVSAIGIRDEMYAYEIRPVTAPSSKPPATPPPPPPVAPPLTTTTTTPMSATDPTDDLALDVPTAPTAAEAGFDDDAVAGNGPVKRAKSRGAANDDDDDDDDGGAKAAPSRQTEENGDVVVVVQHMHHNVSYGCFGLPLILTFPGTPTYLELARSVYDRIKRTLLPPPPAGTWSSSTRPVASSFDSDSGAMTASAEAAFPPERLAALSGGGGGGGGGGAGADDVPSRLETPPPLVAAEEPAWLTAIEDADFRAVLRDVVIRIPITSYRDRELTYGDGGPLDINSRDTITFEWRGALDSRYDPAADRLYPKDESFETAALDAGAGATLDECMALFMKREQLGADNPWYCNVCKEHRRAFKKFDIWRWPKVLVVHLKRFSFSNIHSSRFVSRGKLDTLVSFPIDNLDMRAYAIDGSPSECANYQLYAISNHMGGMGGGHYIAHATHEQSKAPSAAEWHCFDDGYVSHADQRVLTSPSAYLLFYRRKDSVAEDEAAVEQYELDRPRREQALLPKQPEFEDDAPTSAAAAASSSTTTTVATTTAEPYEWEINPMHGPSVDASTLRPLDESASNLPDVPDTRPDDGGFSD